MEDGKCPECKRIMAPVVEAKPDGLVVTLACEHSDCGFGGEYGTYVYFGDMEESDC